MSLCAEFVTKERLGVVPDAVEAWGLGVTDREGGYMYGGRG